MQCKDLNLANHFQNSPNPTNWPLSKRKFADNRNVNWTNLSGQQSRNMYWEILKIFILWSIILLLRIYHKEIISTNTKICAQGCLLKNFILYTHCHSNIAPPWLPRTQHALLTKSYLHTDLKNSKLKFSSLVWPRTGSSSLFDPILFAISTWVIRGICVFFHRSHIMIQTII